MIKKAIVKGADGRETACEIIGQTPISYIIKAPYSKQPMVVHKSRVILKRG